MGRKGRGKCAKMARKAQSGLSAPSLYTGRKQTTATDSKLVIRKEKREEKKRIKRELLDKKRSLEESITSSGFDSSPAPKRPNLLQQQTSEDKDLPPRSFVLHRGKVSKQLAQLTLDLRNLMEPNTASRLKVRKSNNLKDFIVNGPTLGVSHMLVMGQGDMAPRLRLIKLSQGPTLHFKVNDFTLAKNVISTQKRPIGYDKRIYSTSPLIVLTNFQDDVKHIKLMKKMFEGLFPTIKPQSMKLHDVRRCILIDHDQETDTLSLRHYAIKTVPIEKTQKNSSWIKKEEPSSDGEDLSENNIIIETIVRKDSISNDRVQARIRLVELGPRLELSLVKIESGAASGETLFHSYVKKSDREIAELKNRHAKLGKQRRRRELRKERETIEAMEKRQKAKEAAEQAERDRRAEEKDILGIGSGAGEKSERKQQKRPLKRPKVESDAESEEENLTLE